MIDADRGNPMVTPALWHLKLSHYNEKARWALDYKRVRHIRHAMVPGRHAARAAELTGARTFPVLVLRGEAIGDSTRIIAALERHYPDPPLYPADAVTSRRALELEDFFDEELGPHTRRLAFHHMLPEAQVLLGALLPDLGGARRLVARAMYPLIRRRVTSDIGIDERRVALAHKKLRAATERFRAELQPSGYLVGDAFTVADLTLAALLAPLVAPDEYPYPLPQRDHRSFEPVRDELARLGLLDWAREMYARHRGASAEIES